MKRSYLRVTGLVVTATMFAVSIPGGAWATTPEDKVAAAVSEVAPDQGTVLKGHNLTSQGFSTASGHIPKNPSDAVRIGPTENSEDSAELFLPSNLSLSHGEVAADGTVVYQGDVDVAVQALEDDSMRVQTVIPDSESPHEFEYSLGADTTVMEDENGDYFAYAFTDDSKFTQYKIDEPWARDASGNAVDTHFELTEKGDLVQVIEASADTAYPIVADPRWKWLGLGWGAKMNKAETKTTANQGTAAGLCVMLGAGVGAPVCAAMFSHVVQVAKNARAIGSCVFVQVAPMPMGIQYKDSDCY